MRKRFLLLMALCVFADATGAWSMLAPHRCVERCAGGDGDGCAPACPSCVCCVHGKPAIAAAPVNAPVPAVGRLRRAAPARTQSEPDPRDIFHVPRRPLV